MSKRAGTGSNTGIREGGLADKVFARLVVMRDLATSQEVDGCLKIQEERAARGARSSLDVILVEGGILSPSQVSRLLEYQAERIRVCPECDALVEVGEGDTQQCPACRAVVSRRTPDGRSETQTAVTGFEGMSRPGEDDLFAEAETVIRDRPGPPGDLFAEAPTIVRRRPEGVPDPFDSAETAVREAEEEAGATVTRVPQARTGPGDPDEMATRAPGPGTEAPKILKAIPVNPDDPEGLVGKVIGGCEITALLGKGGMGAVYRARRLDLKKTVALKLMPQTFSRSKDSVTRFLREARSAGQLHHPNIVQVFNVGRDQGYHYIEMEFVEGRSLQEVLQGDGKIPREDLTGIMEAAARALEAAHREGVIHRDIKPDNIMITEDGGLKITDFGLARATEDSLEVTREGQVLGTPHYMSPEQCEGLPLDHRSDIYSLGVTFYHMATGRRPFSGDSAVVILRKHIQESPPPASSIAPDLPEGLCNLIGRMMEKERDARYPGMADVILDIERLKLGRKIDGQAAGPAVPSRRRRFPWTFPLGATIILGLLAGVFASPWPSRSPEPTPPGLDETSGAAGRVDDDAPAVTGEGGPSVPEVAPSGDGEEVPDSPEEAAPAATVEAAAPSANPLGEKLLLAWHRQARLVRGGAYTVGTHEVDFRSPEREVRLGPFEISEHEVTNEEYKGFVDAGGYEESRYWTEDAWGRVETCVEEETGRRGPRFWMNGAFPDGEGSHPVVGVSFDEAMAYCDWLSEMHPELEGIRLPREDEWEVAASWANGEGSRDYPWGDKWDPEKANVGSGKLRPVGWKDSDESHVGCRDMAGNVTEWVLGSAPGSVGDPVQRGACFLEGLASQDRLARCASRLAPRGTREFRRRRSEYTGFRVVLPGDEAQGSGDEGR